MMWFRKIGLLLVTFIVIGTIAVGIADEPIENLRVRLEYYPTGELKTELFAKRANVPADGSINAIGLVLNVFTIDGLVEMEIVADDCVYDQDKGIAFSTNAVSLTREDVKVTGKGFNWDNSEKKMQILKKARVVLPVAIVKDKGVLESVKKK